MVDLIRKDASASNGGELTTGTQTVAGNKTWSGTHTFQQPISGVMLGNDYPNLVHNGNFDFWQRGTSGNSANNTTFFLADRWRVQNTMTSNVAVARSTDAPTPVQSSFSSQYSMLLTNSGSPASPSSSFVNIRYVVEGSDYAAIHAQTCRLQFWVKSSLVGTYSVRLSNNDDSRTYIATYSVSQTSTWEKKTIDITMDSTGTWLLDNSAGLRIAFVLFAPAANQTSTLNSWQSNSNWASTSQANWAGTASATFQLAQVMLIPGSFSSSVDLKFKRAGRTVGDELAMCQRYYEKSYDIDTVPGTSTNNGVHVHRGGADSGGNIGGTIFFKVAKRVAPGMSGWSDGGTANQWSYGQSAGSSNNTPVFYLTGNNSTGVYVGAPTAWGVGYIQGHWSASAEL